MTCWVMTMPFGAFYFVQCLGSVQTPMNQGQSSLARFIKYSDFSEIKQIRSGGTVYTAKYRRYLEVTNMEETVVLKQFKSFDKMPGLFISEISNN